MRCPRNVSLEEIALLIGEKRRFVAVSHLRPDGDAIGSIIALGDALESLGKEVVLINQDGVPGLLQFLAGVEKVKSIADLPDDFSVDAVFVLDTASRTRVGEGVLERLGANALVINIDHHISNAGYGDLSYVDAVSPATGQIIYELIRELGAGLRPAARDALWVAIATDTGSFQYPNTTARTFEIGADLVRAGADVGELSRRLYQSYPLRRLELLRELLKVLKISAEGRVASWVLKRETVEKLSLRPEDHEGLIDFLRSVDGVVVAVFFEELEDRGVRISCRSKSPQADVNRMCGKFNGGGHTLAAGARVKGSIEKVEEDFLRTVYADLEGRY